MTELPTRDKAIQILESPKGQERFPDRLFGAVMDTLQTHFYFKEAWHYVVTVLFVFQGYVATVLPAVFYLFIGGRYGEGKTTLLALLEKLTGGLLFENVSIAALARTMGEAQTICLDEMDVSRGRDYDGIRDAFLRTGYKADAAPYARWDVARRSIEEVPIYGPKAATFRGVLDAALQSRGFVLPTVKPAGEEGYEFVLRNMWPDLRELPERLKAWGEDARKQYPPERVQEIANSPEFKEKVKRAVPELGANRESERATIALLVAEMLSVDVREEMKKASEQAQALTGEDTADLLEDLKDVVLSRAVSIQEKLIDESPEIRFRQKEIKDEMNRILKDRGERPLSHGRFAALRRDFGIEDAWLRKPQNRVEWAVPVKWLSTLEVSLPNPLNHTNLEIESEVSNVSTVSKGVRDRILAKVLKRNVKGTCDLCKDNGEDLLMIAPRGSHDMKKVCSPCAETRFDFRPPPGVSEVD
ncbi:MAG: hypothetical protein V3U52_06370 [Thermoplasmata archaeon]